MWKNYHIPTCKAVFGKLLLTNIEKENAFFTTRNKKCLVLSKQAQNVGKSAHGKDKS